MIRYATIGTNFIVEHFLEAAMKQDELYYAAAYSRNLSTAKGFAERHGAERTCTDLDELAGSDDIEAVYVASPNSLHYEQAVLLLSHGKHVLCEKTITSNADELTSLIQLAKSNNAVLLEAMRSVFTPGYAAVAEHLPDLGVVRRASFNYCQYSSRYDKFKGGIIENAFNPSFSNGALMDIGVYCVHPLLRLFGMPREIKTDALILQNGVDGAGTIICGYDTMQAELVYSKISDSRVPSQIQGENGTMTITGIGNPRQVVLYDRKGESRVLFQADRDPDMSGEIQEWIRLIKKDSDPNIHNQYSLMSLQLMDQARLQMDIVFPADKKRTI